MSDDLDATVDLLLAARSHAKVRVLIRSIPGSEIASIRNLALQRAETLSGPRHDLLLKIGDLLAESVAGRDSESMPGLRLEDAATAGLHLYAPSLPDLIERYMEEPEDAAPLFLRSNPLLLTPAAVRTVESISPHANPAGSGMSMLARTLALAEEGGVAFAEDRRHLGFDDIPPPPLPDKSLDSLTRSWANARGLDQPVDIGRQALAHPAFPNADRDTRTRGEVILAVALLNRFEVNGTLDDR